MIIFISLICLASVSATNDDGIDNSINIGDIDDSSICMEDSSIALDDNSMGVDDSSICIKDNSLSISNYNSDDYWADSSSISDDYSLDSFSDLNISNSKNAKSNLLKYSQLTTKNGKLNLLKYSQLTKSANANLTVSPSAPSYKYGSDAILNIRLFDDQTPLSGLVLVTVDNEEHPVNVTNGSARLVISGLENNTYPVLAQFVGDDFYESAINNDAVIVINKSRKVTGNASITEINVYGDDIILTVENLCDVDGKGVSCFGCYQLAGPVNPYALFSVKKGGATVRISGVPVGNYSAYVVFGNNMGGTYELPNFILNFSVIKSNVTLSMDCEDISYGEDLNISISLTDNRGYVVYIIDENSTKPVVQFECEDIKENITLTYGLGSIDLKGLPVGSHTAFLRLESSCFYEEANCNITFKVNKANVNLDVQVDNITYGQNALFNISLTDNRDNPINGTVKLNYGSFEEDVLIENGNGLFYAQNLDIGIYDGMAIFESTDSYEWGSYGFQFEVDRGNIMIDYIIHLDNKIRPLSEKSEDYILFTVKDAILNNVLANRIFSVKINDEIFEYTSDSKGQFKIRYYFEDDVSYNIFANFSGDNIYKEFSKEINLSIDRTYLELIVTNNVFKASHKNKVLTASLKLSNGKAISGKTLRFTLNGKTYLAKTNYKGLAKVKVALSKKGTYRFTVNFLGDKRYSAIENNGKLILK